MPTKKIVDENLDLNGSTSKKRKKRSKKRKKRSKNKSKNKQKTPQSTDLPILMLFPAMFCLVICNNEHYRRMYQHSQVEAIAIYGALCSVVSLFSELLSILMLIPAVFSLMICNGTLSTKVKQGDEIISTFNDESVAFTLTITTNNVPYSLQPRFKKRDTILDVKRALSDETHVQIQSIHLYQPPQGYALDDDQTLEYYAITQPCSLINKPITKPIPVKTIEKATFIKTSAVKKQHYAEFPTLQDYTEHGNTQATQQNELRQFTRKIMAEKPSGDPADKSTLLHLLSGAANNNGKECLFYDSSQHSQSKLTSNSYLNMVDGNDEEAANFVLTLKHLDHVTQDDDDAKYESDSDGTVDALIEMKEALVNNTYNRTMEGIRLKLSTAHGVAVNRIVITDVYDNGVIAYQVSSVGIAYRVSDLTKHEKNKIITETTTLETKMKQLFVDYDKCAIHPALFHNSYDISMFDQLGNKTFGDSDNATYKVGPSGKQREYVQPTGWTRYGLKVLGKYGDGDNDNKWLKPFQDPGNWYRAFHGTSREAGASIYKGAFRSGANNVYGKGIYCSPDVSVAAGYCESRKGIIKLQTKQGPKEFYFVFQVAVNPDTMNNPDYIDNFNPACESCKYWIAPTGADIRPYGILIKEISRGRHSSYVR
eukprot:612290_1